MHFNKRKTELFIKDRTVEYVNSVELSLLNVRVGL